VTTRSDQELVAAANRGDASAMEELYLRHRDWVYAFALKITGNREDAADVLQESFFYLFGKFPGFELRCRMRTFLYPAVRNIAVRARQKRVRSRPIEFGPEPAAPEASDPDSQRRDLAELVADLPEAQREIVLLRFGEDLKLDEIAERLDLPLGTVKSRLHKALSALRERMDPAGEA
jgi:RNA polymerase sigma-70 factor (ECF subfamily)